MFQNIADAEISAGDAALFINSQLKAFNFSADESQHVIGAVNEVANNFAVGTNDLQLALSKTSSAMGGFGNSFEETIGIITAGTEIMVGQPAKVARGWRTIGANITKLAKETDTYKDASGKVNIEMRKQDGTMKNTYEFLSDLHKQWGNLNEEQKTAIALQMGGKNQMEVFMATMNNFQTAIDATNTAMGEENSAAKENAKYLESLQGHLANLKSAWEEFAHVMLNSDTLKKGMDFLTDLLHFFASDKGQTALKIIAIATGVNILSKALLGLKGLSTVKLLKNITGIGKGVAEGAEAMEGAAAAGGGAKLAGIFGRVAGSLFGGAGLITGIGLLSVALAEFIPIGEAAADIKLGKELKKAKQDVQEAQEKYEALNKELDELKQKEKDGTITTSEENRLKIIENQTRQYHRQLELKKQLAQDKTDEYYHTINPEKLTGKAKKKYLDTKLAGKSDKEALATTGINDKVALALDNVKNHADKLAKAQERVTKAYEQGGEESEEYKKALKELDKVQDEQTNKEGEQITGLTKLENIRKKAIKDFGSEEEASKALGQSWKDLNKEIDTLKAIQTLDLSDPAKDMQTLKDNAHGMGITFGKAGKKIRSLNLDTFTQKMVEAGNSVDDTWEYLKKLSEENPRMKIEIDGTKVAIEDLEYVDGEIKKVEKPHKAKVDVETGEGKKSLNTLETQLEHADKKTANPKVMTHVDLGKFPTLQSDIKNLPSNTSTSITANTYGLSSVQDLRDAISNLKSKTINVKANVSGEGKKFIGGGGGHGIAHGVRHFAGGGIANAQVNEQGFEIVRDNATGMMRVINGGKRGYTYLNKGDSVYTHQQSLRMLRNAGLTEGQAIHGHGNNDFILTGVQKLKGYASGLNKEQYNKKYEALTKAYDNALDVLEYKRDRYRWSEKTFRKYYIKLYNKYRKKLKALNKKKVASDVKKKSSLGRERFQDYSLDTHDVLADASKEGIENYIEGNLLSTTKGLKGALNKIKKSRKSKYITSKEADAYRKDAYKKHLEYNLKQYEDDKKSYSKMSSMLKKYYKKGRITAQEYYDYLGTLREKESDKAKSSIESFIDDNLLSSNTGLSKAITKINNARKKGYLTKDEAKEYRKQAYKKHLEYNIGLYQNDKKTYKATTKLLQDYYKKGRISAQEYYDYLAEVNSHYYDTIKESIESFINDHLLSSDKGLQTAINKINTAEKKGQITAKEATAYRKEAYKKHLEYNIKQYQNDKQSYSATLKLLKSYYNSGKISAVEYYDYLETIQEHYNAVARENMETYLNKWLFSTATGLQQAMDYISTYEKAGRITAKEAEEYRKRAYTKHLEYNIKQYQNDKKTFKDTLAMLKKYYNDGIFTAVEYYDYLDSLASTQLSKEKDRLNTQLTTTQNTYDLAKSYVQRQISLLEKENEEQDEQNELIELQNNLAKARNQRVKIYKEGEGFVYEQDTEAIREATEALQEHQKSSSAYKNPVLAQWEAVLAIFDELEADNQLKRLEQEIGASATTLFGSLGTDTNAWSKWIKNSLSTSGGLQDVISNLDKLVDTGDILGYLDSNGQVTQAIINEAIKQNILPTTYASALTQAAQGLGATATMTSIASQSAISSATSGAVLAGSATTYGNIYNFDSLVLPNVTNANEFINELNNLSSLALQASTVRT